jgi:hypothetical protein
MKRFPKYQVIISGDNGQTIVDTTENIKKVEAWIATFNSEGKKGESIQVYERNGNARGTSLYTLAFHKVNEVTDVEVRPIGFGRW